MTTRPNHPIRSTFALLSVVAIALCAATTGRAAVTAPVDTCPADVHQQITNSALVVVPGGVSMASFTVASGCTSVQVTFVSYKAPAPFFTWDNASQQVVYDTKTLVVGAGDHVLQVNTPDCYDQLDLVGGQAITQFGPSGSNNYYSSQGRLITSSNGGTQACADMTAWVAPPTPIAPPIKVAGKKVRDLCKNIKGIQAKTPHGYKRHGFTCSKPKPPVKPTTLPYTP